MSQKKTPLRRKSNQPVCESEANKMYNYWAGGPNGRPRTLKAVQIKFRRVKNTIIKIKKTYKWEKRRAVATAQAITETDEHIQENVRTTRQSLSGVFIKMSKALLDGTFKLEINNIEDFDKIVGKLTTLGRLISELEGIVPTEGGGINLWNVISEGTPKTISNEDLIKKLKHYGQFYSGNGSGNRF